jgi:hypothetical protein
MHAAALLTDPGYLSETDNKNDLGDDCIPAYCQPSVTVHVRPAECSLLACHAVVLVGHVSMSSRQRYCW